MGLNLQPRRTLRAPQTLLDLSDQAAARAGITWTAFACEALEWYSRHTLAAHSAAPKKAKKKKAGA